MNDASIIEDFYTGADGRRLFLRHIEPQDCRGVVIILHGYGEHSGRYLETMQRLATAGFAVYCPDVRGFARSELVPGDMEGIDLIVEDTHLLTALAAERYPGETMILLGHSMGGMLALNQLLYHQDDYDLAVVSGPAVLPPPDANPLVAAVAGVVARLAPRMPVQKLDLSRTTRNEEMIARDDLDSTMYRGKVLARTGYEILRTQKRILASLSRITLPLLLMHGGDDTIIAPRASELVYTGVSSTVKQRFLFPGLYHEILNEPERDEVFRQLLQWLDGVLQQKLS